MKAPNNGWALYGLMQAQTRRGAAEAARETSRSLEQAWAGDRNVLNLDRLLTAVRSDRHAMVSSARSCARRAMSSAVQSVRLATGVTVPFVERGSPDKTPVVLLHGFTNSWRSFEPVLLCLRSGRLFAFSQRGHGDAGRPESFRPEDFSADLFAFLDALDVERAIIVGHSMGSLVAQRFAIDHPERIQGLVLVGAFACLQRNPAHDEKWERSLWRLQDPVPSTFAREFQQSTIAQLLPQPFLDMVVRESTKVPARVWQAAWEGMLVTNLERELHRIAAPTLLVWGDRDACFTRSEQRRLHRGIPSSRLLIYRGAGHALHWEQPNRFAQDLQRFIAGVTHQNDRSMRTCHGRAI